MVEVPSRSQKLNFSVESSLLKDMSQTCSDFNDITEKRHGLENAV